MYATCITCTGGLGSNRVLEAFPVGRRLAFDGTRGRLWVLCRRCRSWNLAPIEERWEAVEAAERLFERAELGAATEHITLGRVADGTQLVRVGRAPAQEVAGWRYGTELVGRWRRHRLRYWALLGGMGVLSAVINAGSLAVIVGGGATAAGVRGVLDRRPFMRSPDGTVLRKGMVSHTRLIRQETVERWALEVRSKHAGALLLTGRDALRALRGFLAHRHMAGADPGHIEAALAALERYRRSPLVIPEVVADVDSRTYRARGQGAEVPVLDDLPEEVALALEIAVNEEAEHRALHGELKALEHEWREAEELAAISDALVLPAGALERIRRWRGREAAGN